MARGTFVLRDGKLVPKHLAPPLQRRGPMSSLPRPHVISDGIEMVHPATGEVYTSKARFRDETRARGLTEIGNETLSMKAPDEPTLQEIGEAVKDAYEYVEGGNYVPEPMSTNRFNEKLGITVADAPLSE